eukprot:COSAG06_NODE_1333_length_9835_cov_20.745994_4_plen_83_part_00
MHNPLPSLLLSHRITSHHIGAMARRRCRKSVSRLLTSIDRRLYQSLYLNSKPLQDFIFLRQHLETLLVSTPPQPWPAAVTVS